MYFDLTHREDSQEHVIIVDEEDELLFAERKLSCHSKDEVFHFHLESRQTPGHSLLRVTLINAHHCRREFGVTTCDLGREGGDKEEVEREREKRREVNDEKQPL